MLLALCTRRLLRTRAASPTTAATMLTGAALGHERRLLKGVLVEALRQQERKRDALEQQAEAAAARPMAAAAAVAAGSGDDDAAAATKARAKAERRAAAVPRLLAECDATEERLRGLVAALAARGGADDLGELRRSMEDELGLAARLAAFDVDANARNQYGRPDGFDGLVVESPRGVPILVARRSYADSLLRRVGRGTDLWFQVREGRGSRVLLRTSMERGLTRGPRECVEAAADLAAYFSDCRGWADEVEVMYTDSRHVAKRGGRVGQMKEAKRLGVVWARPERVAERAREAQEEQGWPL